MGYAGFDRGTEHQADLSSAEWIQVKDLVFFTGELANDDVRQQCEPYKIRINGREGYRFVVRSIQGNVLRLGSYDEEVLSLNIGWKSSPQLQRINGIR